MASPQKARVMTYRGQPARASWGSWNMWPVSGRRARVGFYARIVALSTDGELNHCLDEHQTRREAIACARELLRDG